MIKLAARFLRDEKAATAIEYGLIAALIALIVITALTNIGTKLSTKFAAIATNLR
jgi:pilus assembly protein Flp/PilA